MKANTIERILELEHIKTQRELLVEEVRELNKLKANVKISKKLRGRKKSPEWRKQKSEWARRVGFRTWSRKYQKKHDVAPTYDPDKVKYPYVARSQRVTPEHYKLLEGFIDGFNAAHTHKRMPRAGETITYTDESGNTATMRVPGGLPIEDTPYPVKYFDLIHDPLQPTKIPIRRANAKRDLGRDYKRMSPSKRQHSLYIQWYWASYNDRYRNAVQSLGVIDNEDGPEKYTRDDWRWSVIGKGYKKRVQANQPKAKAKTGPKERQRRIR